MSRIFRTLCLCWLTALALAACQSNPQRYNSSSVGHCSAGFDAGIAANLQAELERAEGRVTADFGEYARTVIYSQKQIPASERQVMYSDYINCVMVSSNRNNGNAKEDAESCQNKCEISYMACESRVTQLFDACISQAMDDCYVACRKDQPADDCYARICAWSEMVEADRAPYVVQCKSGKEYIDRDALCVANKADCSKGCQKK